MAITLLNSNWTILLPPKTASNWVETALGSAGVRFAAIPNSRRHSNLKDTRCDPSKTATFVRHPLSWHASYWSYRSGTHSAWDDTWALDRICGRRDFQQYVAQVASWLPNYVTTMFEGYTGPAKAEVAFVGKQEFIAQDLIALLTNAGEDFDEYALIKTPPVNISTNTPEITEDVRALVFATDRSHYERHKYSP